MESALWDGVLGKTFSQMFTTRLRMQKQPNAPMPKKGAEYGNYEKFEKNKITEESDQGT